MNLVALIGMRAIGDCDRDRVGNAVVVGSQLSAPKKDRDHELGIIPGHNDKDRPTIPGFASEPRITRFIERAAGWVATASSTSCGLMP
jgi:hypothetical protein